MLKKSQKSNKFGVYFAWQYESDQIRCYHAGSRGHRRRCHCHHRVVLFLWRSAKHFANLEFQNPQVFYQHLHIMLRDLLTQRLLILDTPEHVDSEKPNRQIDSGPPSTNFFQNVAKIGKN
jgi:hypothetical protein